MQTAGRFFYISEVEFGMDKKKEASRKCLALGGKVDAFGVENELKDLRYYCYPWTQAFKSGDRWIDNNNNKVKYLPWAENETTYPNKFKFNKYLAKKCNYKIDLLLL